MKTIMLIVLLLSNPVLAKPEVIADFGGKPTGIPDVSAILQSTPAAKAPKLAPVLDPFPVESSLSLGKVLSREHQMPLTQSFAIVGGDAQSLNWLSQNSAYFVEQKTKVFITNLNSQIEFDHIQSLFQQLTLIPVNVDELAQLFGLQHYPVFVNATSIQQ